MRTTFAILLLILSQLAVLRAKEPARAFDGSKVASLECPKGWTAIEGKRPKETPGIVFGGIKGPDKSMILFWTIDRNKLDIDQTSGFDLMSDIVKESSKDFQMVDGAPIMFGKKTAIHKIAKFFLDETEMRAYWLAFEDDDYVYVLQGSAHFKNAKTQASGIRKAFRSFRLERNKSLKLVDKKKG